MSNFFNLSLIFLFIPFVYVSILSSPEYYGTTFFFFCNISSPERERIVEAFMQSKIWYQQCLKKHNYTTSEWYEGLEDCKQIKPFGSNAKEMANQENCKKNAQLYIDAIKCSVKIKDKQRLAACISRSDVALYMQFMFKPRS